MSFILGRVQTYTQLGQRHNFYRIYTPTDKTYHRYDKNSQDALDGAVCTASSR